MLLKSTIKEFSNQLGDKDSLLDVNYPRIAEKILLHWGYKEFYPFIEKLLVVEKDRNRQGFPLEVLEEIFLLQEIHEKKFPATRSSIDKR
ncbi:MAG: hypothetical protein LM517_10415 [Nitrosomonas sp.]|nr:hypothetical protein [Nitrosomonas sp.]